MFSPGRLGEERRSSSRMVVRGRGSRKEVLKGAKWGLVGSILVGCVQDKRRTCR